MPLALFRLGWSPARHRRVRRLHWLETSDTGHRMRDRVLVGLSFVVAIAMSVRAAPPATQHEGKPQTGTFTAKFSERSPMSAPNELSKRLGEKQAIKDYDLSQHEFVVHVPPDYD